MQTLSMVSTTVTAIQQRSSEVHGMSQLWKKGQYMKCCKSKAKPSKKQSKPVISLLHTTGTARTTLELTSTVSPLTELSHQEH